MLLPECIYNIYKAFSLNPSYRLAFFRHGTDNAEKTYVIVDVFILCDCLPTNRNIRYNNGLPIVVMQY
jgi:hypothetical protein